MVSKTISLAANLARKFEGLRLRPYLCAAGVPTIGYGATYYENGKPVTLNDLPITDEYAETLLIWMIETKYLPGVLKLCPNVTSPEKLAALVDFSFNLGLGRLQASTLRKKVNAEDWEAVPDELRKWVKGGGKVLKGLVIRREAEIQLINTSE